MDQKKKVNIKTAGLILIGLFAILLFVSKTIYTYGMPVVTAAKPANGKLNKTEKTKGIADWADIIDIFADVGGKVENVYVKDGDFIEEGQALFDLSFDKDEINNALKELEVSRNKIATDISSQQLKIENNYRHIQELKSKEYKTDFVSDYEITQAQSEIDILTDDISKLQTLYQVGSIPKSELDKAQNDLKALQDKKSSLEKTYSENLLNQNEAIEENEKNRDIQILDYEAEIEALKKEITQNELDLQNNQIKQEAYRNNLQKFSDHTVIYAASSGKLMDFDVKKGQKISDNFFVGRIGIGNQYEIKCELSLDNNFVVTGDTCKVKNANHSFTGTVTKITLSEKAKNITISLESDEISSGETFDVLFEKNSNESYILVPNGALNIDSDGYYLYQIKRRDGMIGQEFYAQKLRVYIGDNDDNNTAITKGVSFFEPIVVSSDKPFTEGQAINLNNVGDFFEE